MVNIWGYLFGGGKKSETRYTLDQVSKWISGASASGSLLGSRARYGNEESIGNNFEGYVTQAYQENGIVFACAVARMLVFSEARIQYQKLNAGRPGDLVDHPALRMFDKPFGPPTIMGDLFNRGLQDTDCAGNFYAVKEGVGSSDKPYRLRRLRPDWVDIILSAPPDKAVQSDILGYVYKPGGTTSPENWIFYPIDGSNGAVVHWAPIPDPLASFRGMSWITPVIREVMADGAATRHKAKFFENAATPNIAVSFAETVTAEQFEGFMEVINSTKSGVEHAYETLYLGGGADVTVIGKDLAQLDFKVTQGAGETRIAAAARIHPVLVGLSEGMQGSSLNAGNYAVAKRAFADGTLRSLWRTFVGSLAVVVPELPDHRLWYDARDIAYLREDAKDLADVQKIQSSTITQYTREGFTAESAKLAVLEDDVRLLVHTGLFSVQLQRPGADGDPSTEDGGKDKKVVPDDGADAEGDA